EGLAIWALAGAYLAPILLPPPTPNPEAFLGYLEVIGLGTGLLAYTMSWRRAFDLALAGYFLLAPAGASRLLSSAVGCWFLAAGWPRRATPHLVMGFALAAWAVAARGSPPTVVVGWTALALAGLAAEQLGGRPGGRLAALGLALLAFPCLFGVALWSRPSDATTFSDPWARALYGYVAGTALAARRWNAGVKHPGTARWTARGEELLWVLCG